MSINFSFDEHNCLTIETEDSRILLFLDERDKKELYNLAENYLND